MSTLFLIRSTVSSRLTLKERRIHTRFPVFILGVYLLIDFESRCIGRVLLVRGSRIKNEVYIYVSQKSQKSQRVWETFSSLAFESFSIFRNFRKNR